jgi:hypothetical protein
LAYNSSGKLNKVTFPDGAIHHYLYDKLGFRKQTKRSDNSGYNYHYDSLGNLNNITHIAADGQRHHKKMTLNTDNQVVAIDMTNRAPLTVKYTSKGNPKSIVQGDRKAKYQYDKLGRLTNINDSLQGELSYQYQKSEVDIRVQQDSRTQQVSSPLTKVSSHNQNVSQLHYTRMTGSPWQAVTWNASLAKLLVPSPITLNAPDVVFQSSKQRRRLFDVLTTDKAEQRNFDKPSSSFYIPAEYEAINCEIYDTVYCSLYGVILDNIGDQRVNSVVNLSAVAWGDFDCDPEFTFMDHNVFIGRNQTGVLPYAFTSSGQHSIKVNSVCTCRYESAKFVKWDVKTVNVDSGSCSADSLMGCLTVTTTTVATQPSDRSRKKLGVGEEVRLTASKSVQWVLEGEGKLVTNGVEATFTAGEKASRSKIKVSAAGETKVIDFEVVKPTLIKMKVKTIDAPPIERTIEPALVYWPAQVYVLPDDMSFYRIEIYEPWDMSVKAQTSGYFSYQQGELHFPRGEPMIDGAKIQGTNMVESGFGTKFEKHDNISGATRGMPYTNGEFKWLIPWHYQVSDSVKHYLISVETQRKIIDSTGKLTVSKGSHSESNK